MAVTITKPVVNGSAGTWGSILNQALDDIVTGVNGNVPASTATAKGDLLVATASGTVTRLGVGSDGQRLVADSTQTAGVKWASPSVPSYANYAALPTSGVTYGTQAYTTDTNTLWTYLTQAGTPIWLPAPGIMVAQVYQSATQNLTDSTWTPITFGAATSNVYGAWSSGTNPSRFTAPWPGYYEFSGAVGFNSGPAGHRMVGWRQNGTGSYAPFSISSSYLGLSTAIYQVARPWVYALSANGYVELMGEQTSGSTVATITTSGFQSSMLVKYLGNNGLQ